MTQTAVNPSTDATWRVTPAPDSAAGASGPATAAAGSTQSAWNAWAESARDFVRATLHPQPVVSSGTFCVVSRPLLMGSPSTLKEAAGGPFAMPVVKSSGTFIVRGLKKIEISKPSYRVNVVDLANDIDIIVSEGIVSAETIGMAQCRVAGEPDRKPLSAASVIASLKKATLRDKARATLVRERAEEELQEQADPEE